MSALECNRHRHCAYSGTEVGLCPTCHATTSKCAGRHGKAPYDGSWLRGRAAGKTHGTLRPGEALHPDEVGSPKLSARQPPQHPLERTRADLALTDDACVETSSAGWVEDVLAEDGVVAR
jgi:hypothetical protein